jgi:hypothetical protein
MMQNHFKNPCAFKLTKITTVSPNAGISNTRVEYPVSPPFFPAITGTLLAMSSGWMTLDRPNSEVPAGHFIQKERPDAVIDAVLSVAAESGADIKACQR